VYVGALETVNDDSKGTDEKDDRADFDLVVIGTGEAGPAMARRCRREGWYVAVADERLYGGTCGQRGCVPKKVLHGAATTIDLARRLADHGVAGDSRIDWPALMRFKRSFTDEVAPRREEMMAERGIVRLHGHAEFTGPNELRVGSATVRARFIGIATGSTPRPLGVPGDDLVLSSEDFLALESLPRRLVFIGGGFISFEFGFIAAAAGAEVTILHRSGRVLKEFDPFLVDLLVAGCEERGVRVEVHAPLTGVERRDDELVVRSGDSSFPADAVVHGAGRVPKTSDLALERAGIRADSRGIVVNEYLQSVTNPSVYVAGDANPRGRMLSPVAHRDGLVAAENMLYGNAVAPDYSVIPTAVFTHPALASVGLGVEEAKRRGIVPSVYQADTRDWFTTRRLRIPCSGYTVITDGPMGPVLGAHVLGDNADEMINVFTLAINKEVPLAELVQTIWAYPTAGHDIRRIR
jgi:glutathione reductase (NADPH)